MLITLEGIDGSGKTSVQSALGEAYPAATLTREPTDSWYGDAVRRSIGDPDADPLAELFLYTADHAEHLAVTVRPALAAGELVISDRYSDSRYAYQAATLAADPEHGDRFDDPLAFVRRIHEPWTRPPDATVYFDVEPETGAERSGSTNKFEQVAFLARVRGNYERLLAEEPERFVRIDANRELQVVLEDALFAIDGLVE